MTELYQHDWLVRVDRYELQGFDLEFEVHKDATSDPNSCSLRIWNLAPDKAAALESLSLRPSKSGPQVGKIRVEVEVGYKTTGRFLIFRGDLRTCLTVTEGPDRVTTIEGDDGGRGVLLGRVSQTFPPGTPYASAVRACVKALGIGEGNLGSALALLPDTMVRGRTINGEAGRVLTSLLAAGRLRWSVQDGHLQIAQHGKTLSRRAVVLASRTNLVGSPARAATGEVLARTLIVPDLIPRGQVLFESRYVQGLYSVSKIDYSGSTFANDWYADVVCKEIPK